MSENYRILVVNDSYLMRSAFKRILSRERRIASIDEASNGLDALSIVKEQSYDLILLGLDLPGLDGIEFIKRSKLHSQAQIIIVSPSSRMGSVEVTKALFFGAAHVIETPEISINMSMDWIKANEVLKVFNETLIAC